MDARRWKETWLALVVITSLLTSCRFGLPATPSADTQPSPSESGSKTTPNTPTRTLAVDPNQQAAINKMVNDPDFGDIVGTSQSEQEMKSLFRDTGGARDLLGSDANAVFQRFDAAEIRAVSGMRERINASTAGFHPVLFSKARSARLVAQSDSDYVLVLLLMAPMIFADIPRDSNGQVDIKNMEINETKDGVTTHMKMHPTINGSTMTASIEMTIETPGPPAYRETINGTLVVELCPDADGTRSIVARIKNWFRQCREWVAV